MKIDLHCHTKRTKRGDGEGRNVSKEKFREKIINSDVKIVAITNHNEFDLVQYTELKDIVKDCCDVWPGVEIDVQSANNKKYHLIVVSNPNNANLFNKKVQSLYAGKDIETCLLSIENVYNSLNECDVIYIPHLHKKPGISQEDQEILLNLVGDKTRIFGETADNRSLGVFANHDYNVIIGSDVKDWNKYEESTFAELKLPVESFSQLCLLSQRDITIVDTLLNKKHSYSVNAKPHKSVNLPLKIYNDVNIIFGQKGTGKSEILNSMHLELVAQGLSCVKYIGSEKDDEFKALLKTNDMERDLSSNGVDYCKDSFDFLRNWEDLSPTSFTTYISWYNTKGHNENKRRMRITEATAINEIEPALYQELSSDKKNIAGLLKLLEKISVDYYLNEEEIALLNSLLRKICDSNKRLLSCDLIDIYSTRLTNYSINKIKSIADRNSDSVSKPSSTGFFEFAQNRLKIKSVVNKILSNIKDKEWSTKELLGELEDKGNLYVKRRYRMLTNGSKAAEFNINITPLKKIKALLMKIDRQVFNDCLANLIDDFNSECNDCGVDTVKPFLGLSKQIVTEDDNEYTPSNGEKGILLLQKLLKSDAQAYFLDEPELGMGNSYIDAIIRPQICRLAQRHKAVIIATHNANIAVRTLPYMSIFRTHENGLYSTYTGNPFNDRLLNISNENDVRSWTSESLHTLEGGKEAFYERKNIYESNYD